MAGTACRVERAAGVTLTAERDAGAAPPPQPAESSLRVGKAYLLSRSLLHSYCPGDPQASKPSQEKTRVPRHTSHVSTRLRIAWPTRRPPPVPLPGGRCRNGERRRDRGHSGAGDDACRRRRQGGGPRARGVHESADHPPDHVRQDVRGPEHAGRRRHGVRHRACADVEQSGGASPVHRNPQCRNRSAAHPGHVRRAARVRRPAGRRECRLLHADPGSDRSPPRRPATLGGIPRRGQVPRGLRRSQPLVPDRGPVGPAWLAARRPARAR